jgi:hypothetical protein
MKKNLILISTLAIIIITNSSCVHYYYAPSANNVPLFKEKSEARVQAQLSSGNNYSGFDIQSAYAISNHAAVQLNIFHASEDDDEYGSGNGTYVEVAGGYYKPSPNKHWIFETYAGIGLGGVKNIYGNGSVTSTSFYPEAKTSVTKLFLQPSFGFTSNHFAMAVSSKLSTIKTGVNSSSLTKDYDEYEYEQLNALKGKSYFFWEPGIMLRGGFKSVQFLLQYTHSFGNSSLPADDANVSFGIVIPISKKSKAD